MHMYLHCNSALDLSYYDVNTPCVCVIPLSHDVYHSE